MRSFEANIMIETKDQVNCKYSDAKLRADDESTEEIPVENAAINKWIEENAKSIKIMAQIRINESEYSVANLRANPNAIERDFPEEQHSKERIQNLSTS